MIHKVLIANRGEIAVRIIRTCREMGIKTVAVYSTIDRDALHVKMADQSVCIGPPPSAESYLNIPSILSAVEITDADADPPRLRLSRGERRLRGDLPELRRQVHRPLPGGHPPDGRQDRRPAGGAESQGPGRAGKRAGDHGRGRRPPHRERPRVPRDRQGGGGRRRPRDEDRPQPGFLHQRLPDGPVGGAFRLRRPRRVHREIFRLRAARRSPDHGRPPRQRHPPGGPRLLHAAPAPEADRGIPRPRDSARGRGKGCGRRRSTRRRP